MYPAKETEKLQARELYLNTDLTQSQIADQIGVSSKAISIWARKGAWRQLKENSLRVPAMLADALYYELEEINYVIMQRPPGQRYATPKEAEARKRIIASIGLLKKQLTTPEAAQVIRSFMRYIRRYNTVAADAIKYLANDFMQATDVRGYRPFDMEYKADDDEALDKEDS